jgi:hypothetical protein
MANHVLTLALMNSTFKKGPCRLRIDCLPVTTAVGRGWSASSRFGEVLTQKLAAQRQIS